jgi:hypothetical protein
VSRTLYGVEECLLATVERSRSNTTEFSQTKPQELDFKERQTEEALWINRLSNLHWIHSKLFVLPTQGEEAQPHNCSNFQVHLEAPQGQCGKQQYFS